MNVQDTVDSEHAVRLSVVLDDPEGVELGDSVGRSRVEGRRLGLRGLDDLSIKLGCRGLYTRSKQVKEVGVSFQQIRTDPQAGMNARQLLSDSMISSGTIDPSSDRHKW
jgi:hypothetical protein